MEQRRVRVSNDPAAIIAGGVLVASAFTAPAAAAGFGSLWPIGAAGAISTAYLVWTAIASRRDE